MFHLSSFPFNANCGEKMYLVSMVIVSIFMADSGESRATVQNTWVWPRWNRDDPCRGLYRSTWQEMFRSSSKLRPSQL